MLPHSYKLFLRKNENIAVSLCPFYGLNTIKLIVQIIFTLNEMVLQQSCFV